MGLLDIASGNSVWRGVDYYERKKINRISQISGSEYDAEVIGSEGAIYSVHMDVSHPRKSTCNCPHANGKRIVCKHIVATFFTVFPDEYKSFMKAAEEYEAEEELREQEEIAEIEKYVMSLSKAELQSELIEYMIEERINNGREYW